MPAQLGIGIVAGNSPGLFFEGVGLALVEGTRDGLRGVLVERDGVEEVVQFDG